MANFTIGTIVINFGIKAEVIGFHKGSESLVLFSEGIGKWVADPGKCQKA